jgi:Spy/CpxP family protein refolding chaperone
MDAFSVAAAVLGDLALTPGQLAQLRALDHRYQQRRFELLHAPGAGAALAEEEERELRQGMERDVLELLTPEQRGELEAREAARRAASTAPGTPRPPPSRGR